MSALRYALLLVGITTTTTTTTTTMMMMMMMAFFRHKSRCDDGIFSDIKVVAIPKVVMLLRSSINPCLFVWFATSSKHWRFLLLLTQWAGAGPQRLEMTLNPHSALTYHQNKVSSKRGFRLSLSTYREALLFLGTEQHYIATTQQGQTQLLWTWHSVTEAFV